MNDDSLDDTFEEGRVALYKLERQLKNQQEPAYCGDNRSEVSKQHSSSSDRRALDQLPRNTRLNQRLESLGLTVEELDDRGLLEGGGSVPSYYLSMKQKNRRVLELQPRSHRLQERGKETLSRLLNGLFHMIRILSKKGLDLEQYFRNIDRDNRGLIHRKYMTSAFKQLMLPFNMKEYQEVANNYVHSSTDCVDYMNFLRDGRLLKSNPVSSGPANENETDSSPYNLSDYTKVLQLIKQGLHEVTKSLNKQTDDIYRMFAVWDTQGTGNVTATQFLRVLSKLHIHLSDQDQDFVVELLDINRVGRIDFEALLGYCFETSETSSSLSPLGGGNGIIAPGTAIGFDDNAGETLSAVSLDGNTSVEVKSTNSSGLGLKRPHTASISRPYSKELNGGGSMTLLPSAWDGSAMNHPNNNNSSNNPALKKTVRPLTASARVSSSQTSQQPAHHSDRIVDINKGKNDILLEEEVIDLPDDVIHGEEMYLNVNNNYLSNKSNNSYNSYNGYNNNPQSILADNVIGDPHWNKANTSEQRNIETNIDLQRGFPLERDHNHGSTDRLSDSNQEDPIEFIGNNPMDHLVLLANQILGTLRDIILTRYRRGRSLREIFQHFDRDMKGYFDAADFIVATADLKIETSDRVAQIAIEQIALDSKSWVTFGEFTVYVLDSDHSLLESNITEQMAQLFEQHGKEFLSSILNIFYQEEDAFNDSKASANSKDSYLHHLPFSSHTQIAFGEESEYGSTGKSSFINSLKRIGLILTASEITRLISRFDVNGTDQCSIDRFVRMITTSRAWKKSEEVLIYQEQAVLEADWLRTRIALTGERSFDQILSFTSMHGEEIAVSDELLQLPNELINMCEYLGIRVLSEQDMIWIASDALRAPLPLNWTVKKDSQGRTYFFNHLTNQSKWEHPLDPHFRNLRDKYRQSGSEIESNENNVSPFFRRSGPSPPVPPSSSNALKRQPSVEYPAMEYEFSGRKQQLASIQSVSPKLKYSNSFTESQLQKSIPPVTSSIVGMPNMSKRPISATILDTKLLAANNFPKASSLTRSGFPEAFNSNSAELANNSSKDIFLPVSGIAAVNHPRSNGVPVFDPSVGIMQIPSSSIIIGDVGNSVPNLVSSKDSNQQKSIFSGQHNYMKYNSYDHMFANTLDPTFKASNEQVLNNNYNNLSNSQAIVSAIYSSHFLKTPDIHNAQTLPAPNYTRKQVLVGGPSLREGNSNGNGNGGVNTGGIFVTTTSVNVGGNSHTKTSSSRPKSAVGAVSSTSKMSAVDRAVSLGKLAYLVQQPNSTATGGNISATRSNKLADMLQGNIVQKLDNALLTGQSSNNAPAARR